ncbi:MAG: aldo/keto reductase, partial [Planctomycetales bacterium]|nr:aldo/keto reductase [Planctomycetales bacterium]
SISFYRRSVTAMKYRYLGKSGLLVSRICLGTMTFGMKDWGCDQATAIAMTHRFIEAGGNFIDTADMYSAGAAEEILGTAVKQHKRDELVLATKCWFRMDPSPNAKGLSRKHIMAAVENSLRRLGTDFIDLYQLHGPDPYTPLEETMRAMQDLVQSGKVRYIGCSNFHGWQIVKANALAAQAGWARFISGQHLYNLLRRDVEREILPACADQGLGMLCWSPLASGLLTGKYDAAQGPADDSRIGLRANVDLPRYWNDNSFKIIDELKSVAAECNKSATQVALSWLLHDKRVTAVIVGVRKEEHLTDSLASGQWDLPQEAYQRLCNVVPFAHGYPDEWIQLSLENLTGHEC